jgi:hypothetical protein
MNVVLTFPGVASGRSLVTGKESIPQGLKPPSFWVAERAKPEGLAYLEARTDNDGGEGEKPSLGLAYLEARADNDGRWMTEELAKTEAAGRAKPEGLAYLEGGTNNNGRQGLAYLQVRTGAGSRRST